MGFTETAITIAGTGGEITRQSAAISNRVDWGILLILIYDRVEFGNSNLRH